jgi:NAD(P)-dependent dehydrogenase (short-subunit alcohol dehydrogenase family)
MTNSYPFVVFGDEFKGKRVLVTGGTKGVGEAIVRRFELSGASVATTARSAPAPGLAPSAPGTNWTFREAGAGKI